MKVQFNGKTLAYIGDAVFELHVRKTLLDKGYVKPDDLHQAAIRHTGAEGQKQALKSVESMLNEAEKAVVNRGRNATSARRPKNATLTTYRLATGFEALIGYLYLNEEKRRLQMMLEAVEID